MTRLASMISAAFARRLADVLCRGFRLGAAALVGAFLLSAFSLSVALTARGEGAAADSFATRVAPILIQRCLVCHGRDSVEGGYDISTLQSIFRAGDSSAAPIVAADPAGSELFRRLITDDSSERMPSDGPPLSDLEIESIRQWILAGASLGEEAGDSRLVHSIVAEPHYPPPPQTYARALPVTAIAAGNAGEPLIVGGYRELLLWRDSYALAPERWPGFDVHVSAITMTIAGDWLAVAHGRPGQRGEVTLARLTPTGLEDRSTALRSADIPSAIAFSPSGKLLAIATHDGKLLVVEVPANENTKDENPKVEAPQDEAQAVGGPVDALSAGGGTEIAVHLDLTPHADAIASVAWSADGGSLLTASRDRTARVIRLKDGQSISNYAMHDRAVHGICQISSGTLTIDETGSLRLWAEGSRTAMLARQRVSDAALGLHCYQETTLVPGSGRIMRVTVVKVEEKDGTDKDGKPKTRKVPQWKDLAPLEIDADDVIVSLAVSPDGDVSAGTQSGRIYRWADGATAAEPIAQLPRIAMPGGLVTD